MRTKTHLKASLVMSVLLVGVAPAIAVGGTIYVDADASSGGDGSSWGTAYKYLQDALYKPPSGGDQICVAEGTYNPDDDDANDPNGSGLRTDTFQLINGVEIYGGFAGGETTLDERDWQTNETVLSGEIGAAGNSDNSYHVVTGSGTDANAILDGFTITAGNANGSYPNYHGGGVYNDNGSPTLTNCTFNNNSAEDGGGMFNYASNSMLVNCTFSGNSASYGGAMYNDSNSSPTLTNCTFSANSAEYGGGIYNDSNSPVVTNCILWGNTASWGSQIYNSTSSPTVTYSDVQGSYLGTGNIDADPLFVDANGPDDIIGTNDDDLRLSFGSLCIDAGDNTAVPLGVTTDLDGKARFVDGPLTIDTGNGTPPIVDMGAYEYYAGIIFVDANATGANNGSNWANAYNYFQDALADANSNPDVNEIWVAQGTCKPDANSSYPGGTGDREATFKLINGVGIYGGFAGTETSFDERDWRTYETILSGDINMPGDNSDNSYHVVTGSGTDPNAVLDGFTITAGNANGSWPDNNGGGIYNNSGSPTVRNCTFGSNSAGYGGGIYTYNGSSPTLTNCTFSGNSSTDKGGGIGNSTSSSPELTNCTFSGNSAVNEGGGMYNTVNSNPTVTNCTFTGNSANYGGGIHNYDGSSPTLTNCTLSGNSAWYLGGGVYNSDSNTTLTNCTISGNIAYDSGGGVYFWGDSNPEISECSIIDNTARYDGGGIYCGGWSNPKITNCTITKNSAGDFGGGIHCGQYSDLTMGNSVIAGNSAYRGGGIYCDWHSILNLSNSIVPGNFSENYGGGIYCGNYSNLTIGNCTFTENKSNLQGGGIACWNSTGTIDNGIVWGNIAMQGPEVALLSNSTGTVSYSNFAAYVDDDSTLNGGDGNILANPMFVAPGYWWGDLWFTGDYHLHPDSVCIDAGDPNFVPEPNDVDIDSQPRIVGSRLDMGADEFAYVGDFNFDGSVNLVDFAIFAIYWLDNCEGPQGCDWCDIDGSGLVDLADLAEFVEHWLEG